MGAFERGWAAAELGLTIKQCPYHPATGESITWRNGWRAFWESVGL